jgi:hypothetical protein
VEEIRRCRHKADLSDHYMVFRGIRQQNAGSVSTGEGELECNSMIEMQLVAGSTSPLGRIVTPVFER